MKSGTWFEGYKVSAASLTDRAVEIFERWLRKDTDDGYTLINCASGTDYEDARELWSILPAVRGESRGYAWEKRSMDTLRNLYIWRVL